MASRQGTMRRVVGVETQTAHLGVGCLPLTLKQA